MLTEMGKFRTDLRGAHSNWARSSVLLSDFCAMAGAAVTRYRFCRTGD